MSKSESKIPNISHPPAGGNGKKSPISKAILKALGDKKVYDLLSLKNQIKSALEANKGPNKADGSIDSPQGNKAEYAVTRAVKNLTDAGMLESLQSDNMDYVRLTREGKQKLMSLKLDDDTVIVPATWDRQWRVVLLDLPESRKNERESLRYLLKKAGFVCLKNSAWVSPYPLEHLFINIKKDLGLNTELMVLVTDTIDEDTRKYLFEVFMK